MAVRMRWTSTGADLIGSKPRDGAMLRGFDDPRPGRRETHTHIYLHDQAAPRRAAVRDGEPMTTGGLSEVRRDQTTEPPDAGFRGRPSVDLRGCDH
jgi:hypothetical protein